MSILAARRAARAPRRTRPAIEGMESRKLLSSVVVGPPIAADVVLIKHGWDPNAEAMSDPAGAVDATTDLLARKH